MLVEIVVHDALDAGSRPVGCLILNLREDRLPTELVFLIGTGATIPDLTKDATRLTDG